MTFLDDFLGADGAFQHVGDNARGHFKFMDGERMPPYQLIDNKAGTARDAVMTEFTMKGYDKPVLADECILLGVVTGCVRIRGVKFVGSADGDTAVLKNLKTGDPIVPETPTNDCILGEGEVAGEWPETDVFLARVDCPTFDEDGQLAGVCLLEGATGVVDGDSFEARAMGETPGNSCYAIIAKVAADVPDLASLWVDIDIANPFSR